MRFPDRRFTRSPLAQKHKAQNDFFSSRGGLASPLKKRQNVFLAVGRPLGFEPFLFGTNYKWRGVEATKAETCQCKNPCESFLTSAGKRFFQASLDLSPARSPQNHLFWARRIADFWHEN
jgi:hypothetical protein